MEHAQPPLTPLPGFWWRVLSPLAAVLCTFAALGLAFAVLDGAGLDEDSVSAVATTLTGVLLLGLGIVIWRRLPAHERRAALAPKGRTRRAVAAGIGGGLALVVAAQAILLTGAELDDGARRRLEELEPALGPEPWQAAVAVAGLVMLAPLGEELVFRALLLRALARRMRFWGAALVSSVIFAGAHVDAYLIWPRAIAIVVTGLGLCWLYRRRGYPGCVIAHATVNGVAAVALLATG